MFWPLFAGEDREGLFKFADVMQMVHYPLISGQIRTFKYRAHTLSELNLRKDSLSQTLNHNVPCTYCLFLLRVPTQLRSLWILNAVEVAEMIGSSFR